MRVTCLALFFAGGTLPGSSLATCFRGPVAALPQESAAPEPAAKKARRQIHENEFLVKGTVFGPQGMSFPGAELRIRRAGEKKVHWKALTDRRGEFAVWVPMGSDYELLARARGFEEQTRAVDAKSGARQEDVVFRMQPASGGKTK